MFSITPPNIDIDENEPEVRVCVVTNDSLATEVVATVQTAPKTDAAAQATGKCLIYRALWLYIISSHYSNYYSL